VEALGRGSFLESAAALGGVDRTTIGEWMHRGAEELARRESGKDPIVSEDNFVLFALEAKKAMARAEDELLGQVKGASASEWKAAAWLLERRWSKRWSDKSKINTSQAHAEVLDLLESRLEASTFDEVLRALATDPKEEESDSSC
jgi:hypothetical protein